MDMDDILGRVGGNQIKRVTQFVDELWDSRDRILDLVNTMWAQRDTIVSMASFVQSNQDELKNLIERLPELIGHAGTGLQAAGSGAQRVSALLSGDGDGGPKELSDKAADALDRSREQLDHIAKLVGDIAENLGSVNIPSIKTQHTKVMGISLISGVDIGERPLLGGVTDNVRSGASQLSSVGADFGDIANRFRSLGAQLADAGADLGTVGADLNNSGTSLRAFVGGPAPSGLAGSAAARSTSKKAATKKAAAKKAAAKKVPVKKAAAKKAGAGGSGLAEAVAAKAKKKAAAKKAARKKKSAKAT